MAAKRYRSSFAKVQSIRPDHLEQRRTFEIARSEVLWSAVPTAVAIKDGVFAALGVDQERQ